MKMTMWALGAAAVFLAAMSPIRANVQSEPAEPDMMAQIVTGRPANSGALALSEIIARVRSAGFDPLSRPIQRGGVYVLFALDHQYLDVRLTVDAGNGRVLSATRLAGMRYGGPGFDGYEMSSRNERPPVPPADIPNARAGRNGASASPSLPLPRVRPRDAATGAVKEAAPRAQAEPRAAAAPAGLGVTPAGTSLPRSSTMVPIAPLD